MSEASVVGNSRVGLLTNIYTPYKEALLSELSGRVNLKAYYCALREPGRSWHVDFSGKYGYEILPGFMFHLGNAFLHFNPKIIRVVRRDRPDVLIIGGYSYPTALMATWAARSIGCRTILWSGSTELEATWARTVLDPIKRLLIPRFDGYIAYTSRAAQYLEYLHASPDKIIIAPITVDTTFFSECSARLRNSPGREAIRARLGIRPEECAVVFVGQCIERKGGDVLLRAMSLSRDLRVRLLMVGDGPLRKEWERLTISLGVGSLVTWCGHVEQDSLVEYYVAADLMVLPSLRDPSGNVVNEAMATGLPIIISDRVGTDAVRDGEDGYIVKAGDARSLAAAIRELVSDAELRLQMGASARERVTRGLTIAGEADQFVAAVRRVLSC